METKITTASYHEVIGGLQGKKWATLSIIVVFFALLGLSVAQGCFFLQSLLARTCPANEDLRTNHWSGVLLAMLRFKLQRLQITLVDRCCIDLLYSVLSRN